MSSTNRLDDAPREHPLTEAIVRGLRATPRTLPSALLYDDLGSALFEAITLLPEYELPRADLRLIARHTPDVLAALRGPLEVVELGPGGGAKALAFLGPVAGRQGAVTFTAVDVSSAALAQCRRTLEALPAVACRAVEATYLDGLRSAPRVAGHRRLVLFLGSNLANFERRESLGFLRDVRATLAPGDALLLATDVGSDPKRLLPAYDDALGVTAAFNRNVLVRLNRAWGADFELGAFAHRVRWDEAARRIEMRLAATRATTAHLAGEAFTFAEGDTIWTESSHRFDVGELRAWGAEAGFGCAGQWVDARWPFAHTLLVARGQGG
ncbi:MAG: L-histidine N(alpha)-methyltransferase [Polyangiales bacterium]